MCMGYFGSVAIDKTSFWDKLRPVYCQCAILTLGLIRESNNITIVKLNIDRLYHIFDQK